MSDSVSRIERCVAGSNMRILSMVLPKNSSLAGLSLVGGKISRIPPRWLIVPGISTTSSSLYPIDCQSEIRRNGSSSASFLMICPAEKNSLTSGSFCIKAATEAIIIGALVSCGLFVIPASADKTWILSSEVVISDVILSYGSVSGSGNNLTSAFGSAMEVI